MSLRSTYLIPALAIAAAFLASGSIRPAIAAETDGAVTINLAVNPIVQLMVTDRNMRLVASDINEQSLDSTSKTVTKGRAVFWLASNTPYDIDLTPGATWDAEGEKQVKFRGRDNRQIYIGGQVFLDTDISTNTPTVDGSDIVDWDPVNGNVSLVGVARGVHGYGVGAIFNPQIWSGSGSESDLDAPDGAESIAPPDLYRATITVTVSSH